MIHGLVEGRIAHYIPLEESGVQCGWSAEIIKVVDRPSARVNLSVKHPDTGEVLFKPNVPFVPKAKNVRGSWHYVEKVD